MDNARMPPPGLQLAHTQLGHDGRAQRRDREADRLEGLRRGVSLPSSNWSSADVDDRYLLRIHAAAISRREQPVVSSRRAREAVELSDPPSGSVRESLSRTGILLAGMPAPDLQVSYPHAFGEDRVDFRWKRKFHVKRMPLLGEFDPEVKYTRAQFRGGRCSDEIVWAEEQREDRLRAPGRSMARWLWPDALTPEQLRVLVLNAGLRPEQ